MHDKSGKEKVAPEMGNFPAPVSLILKLEKQVLTATFQEEIEDVGHLLDDEQSILATLLTLSRFILETFFRILS